MHIHKSQKKVPNVKSFESNSQFLQGHPIHKKREGGLNVGAISSDPLGLGAIRQPNINHWLTVNLYCAGILIHWHTCILDSLEIIDMKDHPTTFTLRLSKKSPCN